MNVAEARLARIACTYDEPDMQEVERLLPQVADINQRLPNDATLLRMAAVYGHTNLVNALIRYGADVNEQSHGSNTAYTVALGASTEHHLTLYKSLLAAGSTPPLHSKATAHTDHQTRIDDALNLARMDRAGIIQADQEWYSASHQAWHTWNNDHHRDVTALTPELLIRFHGIGTIDQALSPSNWRDHTGHLTSLLSDPSIPPYCLQHWLTTHPGLIPLISNPGVCIQSWNHHQTIEPRAAKESPPRHPS